ncbi:hypothetical protein Q4489_16585 [Thalassotalea sp. 1_MG-2023]|uniref:hypothetical protein n=1 Tax=Thalassotalea sp. 1_MG-2023 TaxID=3062680 RepID=UPI0026E197DC|nr:hypothetical protein [Thalassotalea sp. 1_MG-2023]MDO6428631.1 hypothetical protein [Thalassotalea sp. 1_MG-2023]
MHYWYKNNGCVAGAIVVSNSIQKVVFSTPNEKERIFHCPVEAWNWLAELNKPIKDDPHCDTSQ